jgi:hypothetical protein
MCDTDCQHNQDQVFKKPQAIQVKTGGGWKDTTLTGRTGNKVYLADKSTVAIDSPLLRDLS